MQQTEIFTQYSLSNNAIRGQSPVNSYYKNSRMDFIIPRSELLEIGMMKNDEITRMSFYVAEAGNIVNNVELRTISTEMGYFHITNNYFNSNEYYFNNMTLRRKMDSYTSTVNTWMEFKFDKTLVWDGNDILVSVLKAQPSYREDKGMVAARNVGDATKGVLGWYSDSETYPFDNVGTTPLGYLPRTMITWEDRQPPSNVTNIVQTEVTPTSMTVTWTNPTDEDFSEVVIKRNGQMQIANGNITAFTDTGLRPDTNYTYTFDVYDTSGNSQSQLVILKTIANIPPSINLSFEYGEEKDGIVEIGHDKDSVNVSFDIEFSPYDYQEVVVDVSIDNVSQIIEKTNSTHYTNVINIPLNSYLTDCKLRITLVPKFGVFRREVILYRDVNVNDISLDDVTDLLNGKIELLEKLIDEKL